MSRDRQRDGGSWSMKNSSAQHARQLYLKAENDLAAAKIGLQHGAALEHFAELERFRDTLPEYTEFAVKLRYDELPSLSMEEAETAFGVVGDLRDWVRIEFRTLSEPG